MSLKVLFVDDEKNVLNSFKQEISVWAKENSIAIVTAESGEEALDIIKNNDIMFYERFEKIGNYMI